MHSHHLIGMCFAILLTSCATGPAQRPSGQGNGSGDRDIPPSTKSSSVASLRGSIAREQAIAHALSHNPTLQSQRAELRALEAEVTQAGVLPNPELGFEAENFAGSGSTRDFDGAEITTGLSQRIETGGKRANRTRVARLDAEILRAEIASTEREIAIAADRAFSNLLEFQKIRELNVRNLARAKENLTTLDALLEAGESNRIDVNKAKLAVSEARELIAEARSEESAAAAELSLTWGSGAADVSASGSLSSSDSFTPGDVAAAIDNHPATRAATLRVSRAQAVYELEKSRRISDVEVGGGIRALRDADETAAVVGVSVPLPFFDRNEGNIAAAESRLERANAESRSSESALRSRISRLTAELRAARSRVNEFDSQTIAAANQALADTREAYAAGKASLLEVLDARETLFRIEGSLTNAQADLLRAQNTLKILTRK